MKIAAITPGFSANTQDWCIPALLDFVRCLAEHEEVHVFALRYPAPAREYRVAGAAVHAIGGGQARRLARASILSRGWRAIVHEHQRARFDVLHAIWADEPGVLATLLGRWLRIPTVVSIQGGELSALADIAYGVQLSWIGRRGVATSLRRATWCTAGSRHMLNAARLTVPGRDWSRATIVPFGTDPDRFSPRGPSLPATHKPVILNVGSLVAVKNHQMLLEAFDIVASTREEVELHVVGDGPCRGSLEALARRLGLSQRVFFHGASRHEQLPAWYRGATLCVLSSRHESQSVVALEAAASGCAVVGPAVGLLPELAPGCHTVATNDAPALAAALLDLLTDHERRASMGAAGRRLVEQSFTVEHSVAGFRAIYSRLPAHG